MYAYHYLRVRIFSSPADRLRYLLPPARCLFRSIAYIIQYPAIYSKYFVGQGGGTGGGSGDVSLSQFYVNSISSGKIVYTHALPV